MADNLDIWNRFADIDPKFTKPITGRDYGGTSPNPQYVIMCLTEMFGPCGKGFGWSVLAEDFKEMGGTFLHWCRIRFWWKDEEGEHSVEEYGQTKAAYVTSSGKMRVDEDAPKKSLTDAIIKGASHIGVAANIFLGRWDDQKYVAEVNREFREEEKKQSAPKSISAAEQKRQLAEIDNELLDAHTTGDVKRLFDIWFSLAERDGWSKDYWDAARRKFAARKKEIEDADDFPGDKPGRLTDADLRNHPMNAG
ncbi:UNVERIFIED_ORG: hypothetical protein J2W19_003193 [Shinella zoogloeoides]|nr:hypothetical protein [Shinella zoogloeoides]